MDDGSVKVIHRRQVAGDRRRIHQRWSGIFDDMFHEYKANYMYIVVSCAFIRVYFRCDRPKVFPCRK